ncbi:MAG: hypothetical protein COY81_02615 [Candidatus Pacebacteria bacterium CG_4_10_14_0_8_um_filter_43_12]|nr:MAG: hypothetical protein COU66_00865 [Candidatus Pacebacteria bacterium CG10_big_fil_rev_8_21_14_0_10_44_11]PIY79434.1 MAG: hypothetical protein COY81_02615 [Candidatus Pacebacteria bacterium CG_4_10_14_0_8_um_filter_43_12]
MIIDSHCHYNLSPLLENWSKYWVDAQVQNVKGSLVVGTSVTTSATAVELATKEAGFLASVGVHPDTITADQSIETVIEALEKLAVDPHVGAIGECGLDYFRLPNSPQADEIKVLQHEALLHQMKLAKKLSLPLIIHLRDTNNDAYWDFFSILKLVEPLNKPFILHCVSGPAKFINLCLDRGAYLGAAGNCTYKNADLIRSLLRMSPKNRVLVETDAPYLPPQPYRGKICQPAMIHLTSDFLEQELQLTKQQLLENTLTVFPQFGNQV